MRQHSRPAAGSPSSSRMRSLSQPRSSAAPANSANRSRLQPPRSRIPRVGPAQVVQPPEAVQFPIQIRGIGGLLHLVRDPVAVERPLQAARDALPELLAAGGDVAVPVQPGDPRVAELGRALLDQRHAAARRGPRRLRPTRVLVHPVQDQGGTIELLLESAHGGRRHGLPRSPGPRRRRTGRHRASRRSGPPSAAGRDRGPVGARRGARPPAAHRHHHGILLQAHTGAAEPGARPLRGQEGVPPPHGEIPPGVLHGRDRVEVPQHLRPQARGLSHPARLVPRPELLVELLHQGDHVLHRELSAAQLLTRPAHGGGAVGVAQQRGDALGEPIDVAGIDQDPRLSVDDHVGHPAHARRDDRLRRLHHLQHRLRAALEVR